MSNLRFNRKDTPYVYVGGADINAAYGPWATLEEAVSVVNELYSKKDPKTKQSTVVIPNGLTIGVYNNNKLVEYWYNSSINDFNLKMIGEEEYLLVFEYNDNQIEFLTSSMDKISIYRTHSDVQEFSGVLWYRKDSAINWTKLSGSSNLLYIKDVNATLEVKWTRDTNGNDVLCSRSILVLAATLFLQQKFYAYTDEAPECEGSGDYLSDDWTPNSIGLTDWSKLRQNLSVDNSTEWTIERYKYNNEWKEPFTGPTITGLRGADGISAYNKEFIYVCSNEYSQEVLSLLLYEIQVINTILNLPDSYNIYFDPSKHLQQSEFHTWYSKLPEISIDNRYIFASERSKYGFNTDYSEWSEPVLVYNYSIAVDGNTTEYLFFNTLSELDGNTKAKVNGIRDWINTSKYVTLKNNDVVTETGKAFDEAILNNLGDSFIWSFDPKGVTETDSYEYCMYRKITTDEFGIKTFGEVSDAIIWSAFGKEGSDGKGIEYIFLLTKTNNVPNIVLENIIQNEVRDYKGKLPILDEYIPWVELKDTYTDKDLHWSDNPLAVTYEYQYLWASVRKGREGAWGNFSTPVIWNLYTANYEIFLSNDNATIPGTSTGSYTAEAAKVATSTEVIVKLGNEVIDYTSPDSTINVINTDYTNLPNSKIWYLNKTDASFDSGTYSGMFKVCLKSDTLGTNPLAKRTQNVQLNKTGDTFKLFINPNSRQWYGGTNYSATLYMISIYKIEASGQMSQVTLYDGFLVTVQSAGSGDTITPYRDLPSIDLTPFNNTTYHDLYVLLQDTRGNLLDLETIDTLNLAGLISPEQIDAVRITLSNDSPSVPNKFKTSSDALQEYSKVSVSAYRGLNIETITDLEVSLSYADGTSNLNVESEITSNADNTVKTVCLKFVEGAELILRSSIIVNLAVLVTHTNEEQLSVDVLYYTSYTVTLLEEAQPYYTFEVYPNILSTSEGNTEFDVDKLNFVIKKGGINIYPNINYEFSNGSNPITGVLKYENSLYNWYNSSDEKLLDGLNSFSPINMLNYDLNFKYDEYLRSFLFLLPELNKYQSVEIFYQKYTTSDTYDVNLINSYVAILKGITDTNILDALLASSYSIYKGTSLISPSSITYIYNSSTYDTWSSLISAVSTSSLGILHITYNFTLSNGMVLQKTQTIEIVDRATYKLFCSPSTIIKQDSGLAIIKLSANKYANSEITSISGNDFSNKSLAIFVNNTITSINANSEIIVNYNNTTLPFNIELKTIVSENNFRLEDIETISIISNGKNGEDGKNGNTTHFAYAKLRSNRFISKDGLLTSEDIDNWSWTGYLYGADVIGTAVTDSTTPPSNITVYKWTYIKGESIRENLIDHSESVCSFNVETDAFYVNPLNLTDRRFLLDKTYAPAKIPDNTPLSGQMRITFIGCEVATDSEGRPVQTLVGIYMSESSSSVWRYPVISTSVLSNGTYTLKTENFTIPEKHGLWTGKLSLQLKGFKAIGRVEVDRVKLEVGPTCTDWCLSENDKCITKVSEIYFYGVTDDGNQPTQNGIESDEALLGKWYSTRSKVFPLWTANKWLWTKTDITWSDDSHTYLYTNERNPNDGQAGQDIIVDGATVMQYSCKDSNIIDPAAIEDWADYENVTKVKGQWLWSKATTYYRKATSDPDSHDAGSSINYNVSYIALNGYGVKSTNIYYKAASQAPTLPKGQSPVGWVDNGNDLIISDNSALHLYESTRTVYHDDLVSWSTPLDDGLIANMATTSELFALSDSKTNVPNNDAFKANIIPASGKWIWSCTKLEFKKGADLYINKLCVGYYAKDGDTWTINEDGFWEKNGYPTEIRAEGKDGTGVEIKGGVDVLFINDTSGSLTSLEGLSKQTLTVGDCYTVTANKHLYFFDNATEASTFNPFGWRDLGKFRGDDGLSSYMHIAYADSDNNGDMDSSTFTTTKQKDAYDWIGLCTNNSSTDPTTYTVYLWNKVKGAQGDTGRGVTSVAEYYKASDKATGETAPSDDSGWSTDPNTAMLNWNQTNKYLWNYEKVTYSSAPLVERTTASVIAIWTKDGAAGKGIDSITNHYKVTKTVNTPRITDSGWKDNPITPTAENPYLWNYETITWVNPSGTTNTNVQMIGYYGHDGIDGLSVKAQYSANGTDWYDTFNTGYVWMRTSTDNGTSWSTAMRIVGENGGMTDFKFNTSKSATSSSVTEPPNDCSEDQWLDAPMTVTDEYPYLWTKISDKDGNGNTVGGSIRYIRLTGENADQWTIAAGQDGEYYWFKNGVKFTDTEHPNGIKAEGKDGTGVLINGSVDSYSAADNKTSLESLNLKNLSHGDCYIVNDDSDGTHGGHLYFFRSLDPTPANWYDNWRDLGKIKGEPGTNGTTYYIHYAYADTINLTANPITGTGFEVIDKGTKKAWIGICVDTNLYDPGSAHRPVLYVYAAYTWNNVKGEPGNNGSNGVSTAHLMLFNRSAGSNVTPINQTLYYKFVDPGKLYSDSSCSKIASNETLNGWSFSIPAGEDPLYVTVATAHSDPNSNNPNIDAIEPNEWTNPVLYVKNGTSITRSGNDTYRYATNNTGIRPAASSQDWSTTKPTLQEGYWLYTETTVHWSDGSSTVLYTDERNPNDGVNGQDIIVDGSTEMKYYVGDNNTTHPAEDSSDWKDLSQVTQTQGKWLWSKATTWYRKSSSAAGSKDAGHSVNYNVSYISKDGKTGRGISSITEYYQATNSSAARQKPTSESGWDTDPNLSHLTDKWDANHKYLWNMEKTVYTNVDGSTTTVYSIPQILAIWTKDGATGKGIDSIQNKYCVTSSSTTPAKEGESGAPTWYNTPLTPGQGQYLWNYEVITWINPSGNTSTDVQMIGYAGTDGASITKQSEVAYYIKNTTGVRPAENDPNWSTTKPTIGKGEWLFTKTVITWSDTSKTVLYTDERNPNDGVNGQDIIVDGATVMKYCVNTSNTTHPADNSSEWKDLSQVTQEQGKWLWSQATTYYRKANSTAGSHDAGSSINYNVNYIAEDGNPGRGITSVTEYYKASANATGETAPSDDSGWNTNPNNAMQGWNQTNKYLWNYEKVTYSSGTTVERSTPTVIAIWTKDGATGKGVDSITNYYKVQTTEPSLPADIDTANPTLTGWSTSPSNPSQGQYLWNFERIVWLNSDGTRSYTHTNVHSSGYTGTDGQDGQDMRENLIDNSESQCTLELAYPQFTFDNNDLRFLIDKTFDPIKIPDHTPLSGQMRITFRGCTFADNTIVGIYLSGGTLWPYPVIAQNITANGTYDLKTENLIITGSHGTWDGKIHLQLKGCGTSGTVVVERVKIEAAAKCSPWCLSENDKTARGITSVNTYFKANATTPTRPSSNPTISGWSDNGSTLITKANADANYHLYESTCTEYTDGTYSWTTPLDDGLIADMAATLEKFGLSNSNSTQPSSWSTQLEPQTGKWIWSKTILTFYNGDTKDVNIQCIGYCGTNGVDGADGANGNCLAMVQLYKTSPTALTSSDKPSGNTLYYKFSDGKLYTKSGGVYTIASNADLNGWSTTIPSDTSTTCYMIHNTAFSNTEYDALDNNNWSAPVIFIKQGKNGVTIRIFKGTFGENNGVVFRNDSDLSGTKQKWGIPEGESTYEWIDDTDPVLYKDYYLDITDSKHKVAYTCKQTYVVDSSNPNYVGKDLNGAWITKELAWEEASDLGNTFFTSLYSLSGNIELLSSSVLKVNGRLLMLKDDGHGNLEVIGGINGEGETQDLIEVDPTLAFWSGGTGQQKADGTINATFYVTKDGELHAKEGVFNGKYDPTLYTVSEWSDDFLAKEIDPRFIPSEYSFKNTAEGELEEGVMIPTPIDFSYLKATTVFRLTRDTLYPEWHKQFTFTDTKGKYKDILVKFLSRLCFIDLPHATLLAWSSDDLSDESSLPYMFTTTFGDSDYLESKYWETLTLWDLLKHCIQQSKITDFSNYDPYFHTNMNALFLNHILLTRIQKAKNYIGKELTIGNVGTFATDLLQTVDLCLYGAMDMDNYTIFKERLLEIENESVVSKQYVLGIKLLMRFINTDPIYGSPIDVSDVRKIESNTPSYGQNNTYEVDYPCLTLSLHGHTSKLKCVYHSVTINLTIIPFIFWVETERYGDVSTPVPNDFLSEFESIHFIPEEN